MKTKLIIFSIVLGALTLSCNKTEDTPKTNSDGTPVPTPVAPTTDGFHWNENGGQYMTADSAIWDNFAAGTGIKAYKDSSYYLFEVVWNGENNTSVGAKTLYPADIDFSYYRGGDAHVITKNQVINITDFKNGLLSGNFNVSVLGSSSVNKIDAVFKGVPKR